MQNLNQDIIHPVLLFMDFGNLAEELKIGLLILRKKHRREEHKIQINMVTFVY
jgi:hypothetical protein